jgi:hypothetical protein
VGRIAPDFDEFCASLTARAVEFVVVDARLVDFEVIGDIVDIETSAVGRGTRDALDLSARRRASYPSTSAIAVMVFQLRVITGTPKTRSNALK